MGSGASDWYYQQVVGETLGEEDGVALIDKSSAVKQGDASVGVAAQYCGSVGKVANGQVGVYLGYTSRKGYSLVEGQLFMPDEWFEEDQAERWQGVRRSRRLDLQDKPEIGLELFQKAKKRGNLSFSWVAADALYGDSPAFRDGIADLDKWYFTEIKCTTPIWRTQPKVYVPKWKGRGRHPTRLHLRYASQHPVQVRDVVRHIPKQDWLQAVIKEGSKGPIACEFAFLHVTKSRGNLPAGDLWLIIRRNLDDPSVIKYYFSNAPTQYASERVGAH